MALANLLKIFIARSKRIIARKIVHLCCEKHPHEPFFGVFEDVCKRERHIITEKTIYALHYFQQLQFLSLRHAQRATSCVASTVIFLLGCMKQFVSGVQHQLVIKIFSSSSVSIE
jgi:hypothetical protein